MNKIRKTAFTLMELLVVVIIVGVLAGIMFPSYQRAKERAIDKQAKTVLPMIKAAQRQYYAEMGHYYPAVGMVTNIGDINDNLNLDIVSDGTWSYYCITDQLGFQASMTRDGLGSYDRTWEIEAGLNLSCAPAAGCP